jgi:hypothetical protein
VSSNRHWRSTSSSGYPLSSNFTLSSARSNDNFDSPFSQSSHKSAPASLGSHNTTSDLGATKRVGTPYITPKPGLEKPLLPHEGVARAIALYDFQAIEVHYAILIPSYLV